jgi:hypothetical protein
LISTPIFPFGDTDTSSVPKKSKVKLNRTGSVWRSIWNKEIGQEMRQAGFSSFNRRKVNVEFRLAVIAAELEEARNDRR